MDKAAGKSVPNASSAARAGWGTVALFAALLGILAGALWYAAYAWRSVEGPPMPASGYIFMTLGVVLSVAVGCGLMGLVFYSSRHGYDEQGNAERGNDERGNDERTNEIAPQASLTSHESRD
jgi:hypothetical protein